MILEMLDPSKRHHLRLLDAIPLGVSVALDGKVAYANDVCARMWGYEHGGRMADLPFFDLIHPEDRAFVMRLWHGRDPQTDDGSPWTYDLRGLRADGTAFPYRCTSIATHVTGHGRATLAFMLDLTELEGAKERARVLEQQMALVERFCAPAENAE